jgi:hypothetical protein
VNVKVASVSALALRVPPRQLSLPVATAPARSSLR